MDGFQIFIYNEITGEQLVRREFEVDTALAYILDQAMADVDGSIRRAGVAPLRMMIYENGQLVANELFENDGGYGD